VGELTNTIAGAFKTKYHEQYGGVALGLPLIISGKLIPVLESTSECGKDEDGAVKFQSNGVVIPFRAQDGDTTIELSLIIYLQ
jgi:CheY-specific phosphatase CheX